MIYGLGPRLVTLLVALAALAGAIVTASQDSSTYPFFLSLSKVRLAAVLLLAGVCIYALVSLFKPRLLAFNNFMAYSFLATFLLLEAMLRLAPGQIPDHFLKLLPHRVAVEQAMLRGIMSKQTVQGDGMVHHWKPHTKIKNLPWVIIDENGFSNKVQLSQTTDVIVLGGSIAAVTGSKRDFADELRQHGFSAYTLAVGGSFGPVEGLHAYKRYIIDNNISHATVILMVAYPIDVRRAYNSYVVERSGGNWRDIVGVDSHSNKRKNILGDNMPWMTSILINLPYYLVETASDLLPRIGARAVSVKFDYAKFNRLESDFILNPADKRRAVFESVVGEIIETAAAHGAKLLLAYHPLLADLEAPYIQNNDQLRATFASNHERVAVWMRAFTKKRGAKFVDLAPALSERLGHERVVSTGYHANERGVEIIIDEILPFIERLGQAKATR